MSSLSEPRGCERGIDDEEEAEYAKGIYTLRMKRQKESPTSWKRWGFQEHVSYNSLRNGTRNYKVNGGLRDTIQRKQYV